MILNPNPNPHPNPNPNPNPNTSLNPDPNLGPLPSPHPNPNPDSALGTSSHVPTSSPLLTKVRCQKSKKCRSFFVFFMVSSFPYFLSVALSICFSGVSGL